ncbi:PepSY domain-containing protein [Gluconobacter albidus]|uniref:PepSY-associated TM helix domain-containing protein n=1 Tax=Gluconobacter albidus TaxID=318683 RepID=UPI0020A0A941|nr:PepSY-associated TM helix domain-containing protein [Gluconobacter albidus]MCP1274368.1 PepSY domain-containing protein [Gluconobacter albidus]
MKIRSDILRVYREVHSWVGICAGLLLFVAFFAGAISMFEQPLQNLTSPQLDMPPPVPLSETPDLLEKVFSAYPQARQTYTILLAPDRSLPGRVAWPLHPPHGHDAGPMFVATLAPDGALVVRQQAITPVAHFIDMLHQELGIPLPHAISRPFMGIIALLYGMALISGVLLFLPTLARNLFAFRFREGPRKLWLDLHNLLGFFSLPFHIVMALTSVVFAFHDPIFAVQSRVFATSHASQHLPTHTRPHPITADQHPDARLLTPTELVTSLGTQAPGFVPTTLAYSQGHGGMMLRVSGQDSRYSMRGPTAGFATVDPRSGKILSADYLPGHQKTGFAILTVFFALHFGSFGGNAIRWGYVVLGLAGAGMFYTGNRLWIDARRRREKAAGLPHDSLPTSILARLTPGWTAGCISGTGVILLAGLLKPDLMTETVVTSAYYGVFLGCIAVFLFKPQRLRSTPQSTSQMS